MAFFIAAGLSLTFSIQTSAQDSIDEMFKLESSTQKPLVGKSRDVNQTRNKRTEPVIDERAHDRAQKKTCNCKFAPGVSYSERKGSVSGFFGVLGGTYAPANYVPDFVTRHTFADYYEKGKTPNFEVVFGFKLNLFVGSIGPHFTGGYFSAKNETDKSKMTVYPVTAGIIYELNNLFKEPYLVPYLIGGTYTAVYSEATEGIGGGGGQAVSGNSAAAGFYAIGAMIQLDWIDPETHISGYEEFGIENTFLFIEGRSFLVGANSGPNFSTPLQINGGVKIEF